MSFDDPSAPAATAAPSPQPELVAGGPRLVVVRAGAVYVQLFRSAPSDEDFHVLDALTERMPHPYGILTIIPQVASARLDKAARQRVDQLAYKTKGWVRFHTGVVLQRGFVGAVARSIMATVNFILADHEHAVVSSLQEGVEHAAGLLPTLPLAPDIATLWKAVHLAMKAANPRPDEPPSEETPERTSEAASEEAAPPGVPAEDEANPRTAPRTADLGRSGA